MAELNPGPLKSYEQVMAFAGRLGEGPLRLAMHAAVPQVLRVELLHLLRLNFLPEAAKDLAVEADVLFAPFCENLGNGFYCFSKNARDHLLRGLDPAYGGEKIPRSVQVARFMLDYLDYEQHKVRAGTDRLLSDWIEVERWSALAFAEPALAAGQLAAALATVVADNEVAARVRVGGLASTLATPLAHFSELLTYAEGLEALQGGRWNDADRLLGAMVDRDFEIAGARLKSPHKILASTPTESRPPGSKAIADTPAAETRSEAEDINANYNKSVYISHSSRDYEWAEQLGKRMVVNGSVYGSNEQIRDESLRTRFSNTKVSIILVSADYLNSEFLMTQELPRLIERGRANQSALFIVYLRPCAWELTSLFYFKAAFSGPPLAMLPHPQRKEAFDRIASEARAAFLADLKSTPVIRGAMPFVRHRAAIFLSYRNEDQKHGSRLAAFLRNRFGSNSIIERVEADGVDISDITIVQIQQATVAMAIIAPSWIARHSRGRRTLDSPGDWLRKRLATMLQFGRRVIPILMTGVSPYDISELPEDIRQLRHCRGVELRDADWSAGCDEIVRQIETPEVTLDGIKSEQSLRIFLSSTLSEFASQRQALIDALLRLGHSILGPTGDVGDLRLNVMQQHVEDSDIFVGIVEKRYGLSAAKDDDNLDILDFLDDEYQVARAYKKPIFFFMRNEPPARTTGYGVALEDDTGINEKFSAFRTMVQLEHIIEFFNSEDELITKVVNAISKWSNSQIQRP